LLAYLKNITNEITQSYCLATLNQLYFVTKTFAVERRLESNLH